MTKSFAFLATIYRFGADGTLTTLREISWGGHPPPGHVSHEGKHCRFDDRWTSESDSRLAIRSVCSDGTSRDVRLEWRSSRESNAEGATVEVVDVNGETGWAHEGFPWRWARCDDGTCEELVPFDEL